MSSHADAAHSAPHRLPALSWRVLPASLVVLAAPAFFVALIPWLGWTLLAAGLIAAVLVERFAPATVRLTTRAGERSDTARAVSREPSIVRDLSLIAMGMLIVSAIPPKASLGSKKINC